MATRRLARTVVEGGRGKSSKFGRRQRNRGLRRWRLDGEGEFQQLHARRPEGREFADRIAPLYRWLDAQCGRPWADVYADFCRENNRRTMKGWHLHSHLEPIVMNAGFSDDFGRYGVFEGILYRLEPWYSGAEIAARWKAKARAEKWAADRFVVARDGVLYWTVRRLKVDPTGEVATVIYHRIAGRMSREDEAIFRAFPPNAREAITARREMLRAA